ncbi:MAG: 50S ribosomal protein L18a [Candidatus Lokiarchaeota archaeon]|nr:50S ribosomal protein L18a [Candidatus Lokiarchaeota archaeon]MBD3199935.1 50S ribosomal protein L18a [Candidatus Lokiarchaeota archaeon]
MSSDEIKIYRVTGVYWKNHRENLFRKEVRAMKEEDAIEKVLSQITSIGLLRRQITIREIEIINPEQAENYLIRELSQ